MTETVHDFTTGLRRAYDVLRQDAAAFAQSPEMVDGLLLQIYDDDERARYDAAQMLTLLPETIKGYSDVRKALVTALLREENPEIRILLAQKVNELVAAKDHLAFGALQDRAASDASVAVRRWCYSGMAGVHEDFIAEATHFLKAQRSSQPDYWSDIDESLAVLKRRECTNLPTGIKNGVNALRVAVSLAARNCLGLRGRRIRVNALRVAVSLAAVVAIVLVILFQEEKKANGLAAQNYELRQQASASASAAENNHNKLVALIKDIRPPDYIKQWNPESQLLGPSNSNGQTHIILLSPINTVVPDRPVFRWKQEGTGSYYRLNIQDATSAAVAMLLLDKNNGMWEAKLYEKEKDDSFHPLGTCKVSSEKIGNATEWTVEVSDSLLHLLKPLKTEEYYQWSVDKLDKPFIDVTALASSASVKFNVADATTKADLNIARSEYAGSHLLLAAYYVAHGFIEEARAELKLEPDTQSAAKLLKSLDSAE